ncbi:MAG: hypothetical protein ACRCZI_03780 [Cetobacterium sp.]
MAPVIATGGLSLVPGVNKIIAPVSNIATQIAAAQFPTTPQALLNTGLAVATKNPALLLPTPTQIAIPAQGGFNPMALNIGGILGQVGTIFGGSQNQVFSGISNVANLASQFFPPRGLPPTGSTNPTVNVAAAAGPAMRSIATVGRGFFNKFPNLATAIQMYRNQGKHVTRAKLWSLVKRFGPEIVVSGGILTAAAVNELMIAGPGHRRMNAGNVKALRRSLRRLESFHTLCMRVDKLRRPRSRKKSGSGSGSTFVRQG